MPTEEQLKEWKAKHGELIIMETEDQGDDDSSIPTFVFRRPNRAHVSRFVKTGMSDPAKGLRQLIVDTLLFPGEEVLEKLLSEKPGLMVPLGSELQKAVGSNHDFFVKRF